MRPILVGTICIASMSITVSANGETSDPLGVQTKNFFLFKNANDQTSERGMMSFGKDEAVVMNKIHPWILSPSEPHPLFSWYLTEDKFRIKGTYSIKNRDLGDEYCLSVQGGDENPDRLQVFMQKCQIGRQQGFWFQNDGSNNALIRSNIRWEPGYKRCLTSNGFPKGRIGFATCGDSPGDKWVMAPQKALVKAINPYDPSH